MGKGVEVATGTHKLKNAPVQAAPEVLSNRTLTNAEAPVVVEVVVVVLVTGQLPTAVISPAPPETVKVSMPSEYIPFDTGVVSPESVYKKHPRAIGLQFVKIFIAISGNLRDYAI